MWENLKDALHLNGYEDVRGMLEGVLRKFSVKSPKNRSELIEKMSKVLTRSEEPFYCKLTESGILIFMSENGKFLWMSLHIVLL